MGVDVLSITTRVWLEGLALVSPQVETGTWQNPCAARYLAVGRGFSTKLDLGLRTRALWTTPAIVAIDRIDYLNLPSACRRNWKETKGALKTAGHPPPNQPSCIGCFALPARFQEIVKEADGWDSSAFAAKSHRKKPWVCALGHRQAASIADRSHKTYGCHHYYYGRPWG